MSFKPDWLPSRMWGTDEDNHNYYDDEYFNIQSAAQSIGPPNQSGCHQRPRPRSLQNFDKFWFLRINLKCVINLSFFSRSQSYWAWPFPAPTRTSWGPRLQMPIQNFWRWIWKWARTKGTENIFPIGCPDILLAQTSEDGSFSWSAWRTSEVWLE